MQEHNVLDVLFISPGNATGTYQDLAKDYSAIEPPTWALLLAESCRSVGFKVALIDVNAEKITKDEVAKRICSLNPRLICFVVYGQNVNAGTTSMSGAIMLSSYIKSLNIEAPISFIGSYVQALPIKTLKEESSVDIVFTNEGVYALRNLLSLKEISINNLEQIKGIGFRQNGKCVLTVPEKLVPSEMMDIDLPGYAWDLLPKKKSPFDLYRSPMWHAEYSNEKRTPYAAIQTSLGCVFSCNFCMINIINRDDNEEIGVAGNYSKMRYWSPEFIIKEFDKLVEMGVQTIRIIDEMFLLNKKYYVPLCEMLKNRGYGKTLRMWAYSRIDTISNPEQLTLIREAGIKWLALGIESADRNVRLEISKGRFQDVDIKNVIDKVHAADIEVIANYIFGLPSDSMESMQKTLELSIELCTAGWNAYTAMPLPGSQLYKSAIDENLDVPKSYSGFSFHAYNTIPLPTEKLTSSQILKFRDDAFLIYHSNPSFLNKIQTIFGDEAVENILEMNKIKLKRELLGD